MENHHLVREFPHENRMVDFPQCCKRLPEGKLEGLPLNFIKFDDSLMISIGFPSNLGNTIAFESTFCIGPAHLQLTGRCEETLAALPGLGRGLGVQRRNFTGEKD